MKDNIDELKNTIYILEKQLAEEKKFRSSMNKMLEWEKERNKIETSGLRRALGSQFKKIIQLEQQIAEMKEQHGTNNKED